MRVGTAHTPWVSGVLTCVKAGRGPGEQREGGWVVRGGDRVLLGRPGAWCSSATETPSATGREACRGMLGSLRQAWPRAGVETKYSLQSLDLWGSPTPASSHATPLLSVTGGAWMGSGEEGPGLSDTSPNLPSHETTSPHRSWQTLPLGSGPSRASRSSVTPGDERLGGCETLLSRTQAALPACGGWGARHAPHPEGLLGSGRGPRVAGSAF